MAGPTSAVDALPATSPCSPPPTRFKLKSPRSLSRLKHIRPSMSSSPVSDQYKAATAALQPPHLSSPNDFSQTGHSVRPRRRTSSSIFSQSPLPSALDLDSRQDNGRNHPSSNYLTIPRTSLTSGNITRNPNSLGISQRPPSSSWTPCNTFDDSSNRSDRSNISSAVTTPYSSPASSSRDLKASQRSPTQRSLNDREAVQTFIMDKTPTKSDSSRLNVAPAGSSVWAMGRKLLRFRQPSASDDPSGLSSEDGQPRSGSNSSESTAEWSPPATPTTPRQGDFTSFQTSYEGDAPRLPPLRGFELPGKSYKDVPDPTAKGRNFMASSINMNDTVFFPPAPSTRQFSPAEPGHEPLSADLSVESFEMLDALEAVMTLGKDEDDTPQDLQLSSLGCSVDTRPIHPAANSAVPSFNGLSGASTIPRTLTVTQLAQLEEEDRSKKSRNPFSKQGFFNRTFPFGSSKNNRPESSLSSRSEDDYGREDDAAGNHHGDATVTSPQYGLNRDGSTDNASGTPKLPGSSAPSGDEGSRSCPHPQSAMSMTSAGSRFNAPGHRVSPGPSAERTQTGLDSAAKRALYSCTLLKIHPQLDVILKTGLAPATSTDGERGHGPVEIGFPRSINTPAKVRAATKRGGSQLGMSGTPITLGSRHLAIALGQTQIMKKLRTQLMRQEEVEIGWFIRSYASELISPEVIVRHLAARPQVSPEALAKPLSAPEEEGNARIASMRSPSPISGQPLLNRRTEGPRNGLAIWAARKPFLERCALIRGEDSTTFNIGDIVLDDNRAVAVPSVNGSGKRRGILCYSPRLRMLAGLPPISAATRMFHSPSSIPVSGVKIIKQKAPPPWIAPRSTMAAIDARMQAVPSMTHQSGNSSRQIQQMENAHEDQKLNSTATNLSTTSSSERCRKESLSNNASAEPQVSPSDSSRSSTVDDLFHSADSSMESLTSEEGNADDDDDDVPIADLVGRKAGSIVREPSRSPASSETVTEHPSMTSSSNVGLRRELFQQKHNFPSNEEAWNASAGYQRGISRQPATKSSLGLMPWQGEENVTPQLEKQKNHLRDARERRASYRRGVNGRNVSAIQEEGAFDAGDPVIWPDVSSSKRSSHTNASGLQGRTEAMFASQDTLGRRSPLPSSLSSSPLHSSGRSTSLGISRPVLPHHSDSQPSIVPQIQPPRSNSQMSMTRPHFPQHSETIPKPSALASLLSCSVSSPHHEYAQSSPSPLRFAYIASNSDRPRQQQQHHDPVMPPRTLRRMSTSSAPSRECFTPSSPLRACSSNAQVGIPRSGTSRTLDRRSSRGSGVLGYTHWRHRGSGIVMSNDPVRMDTLPPSDCADSAARVERGRQMHRKSSSRDMNIGML